MENGEGPIIVICPKCRGIVIGRARDWPEAQRRLSLHTVSEHGVEVVTTQKPASA